MNKGDAWYLNDEVAAASEQTETDDMKGRNPAWRELMEKIKVTTDKLIAIGNKQDSTMEERRLVVKELEELMEEYRWWDN